MRAFFDSLTLLSGALLVAVVSALVALATARLRLAAIRWAMAALVPLALTCCCYWMPVWLGPPRDQDWSWEPIDVGFWWFAGLLASTIVTFIASRHVTRNA